MIIVMGNTSTEEDLERVVGAVKSAGLDVHISEGVEHTIVGCVGDVSHLDRNELQVLSGVQRVVRVMQPFKLVSREFQEEDTVVDVDGVRVGGSRVVVMAGPCAVEDREMLLETAEIVRDAGGEILRGGAFKPRTSPYSFQGLGEEGLKILREASERTGLKVVTEVLSPEDVELVAGYADVLQIGARNMQNYSLLRQVGRTQRPVLLKRGLMSSVEEWLMAAEYVASEGNPNIMLCERGIRTFSQYTRNTLDLSAVPLVQELSHLPVVVDPSHATGRWRLVAPMARAAVAAGADGLIMEVHPRPAEAKSDGPQSLKPDTFRQTMREIAEVARSIGRGVNNG